MKKSILMTAISAAAITSSALAGEPTVAPSKSVTPMAPIVYGTGFYLGLQAGMNAYQDFGGTRTYDVGGDKLSLDVNQNIGFVGGLKAGYVFGTGTVRLAIEADLYYNGVRGDLDARVNNQPTNFNADANLDSGAFLANFLLRFAFDRFQPYVGGGIGLWVAQANDIDVTIAGQNYNPSSNSSNDGLAWQLVAGADYYWAEKFSTFLEYKFLNYENAGVLDHNIPQQIVVLGVRWHF